MRDAFRALLLAEALISGRAHAHATHELVGLFLFILCLTSAFMYGAEPRRGSRTVLFLGIMLPVFWAVANSLIK